jgi:hypothetical protein
MFRCLITANNRICMVCHGYQSMQWRRQGGARGGYTSFLSLSENVWLISCHYSLVNAGIHEAVFYSFNIGL